MPQEVTALRVMISAPGDMKEAVNEIRDALIIWSSTNMHRGAVLIPLDWSRDSVPQLGGSGQAIINQQLLDRADIVFAVFGNRLGSPTEKYVSGTAEEIHEAHAQGKPVHVYFDASDVPRNTDRRELDSVDKFKAELKGLYSEFRGLADLRHQVWRAIEADVVKSPNHREQNDGRPATALILQSQRVEDWYAKESDGNSTERRTRDIRIFNRGTNDAEDVNVEAVDDLSHVIWSSPQVLYSGMTHEGTLITNSFSSPSVRVTWRDADGSHSEVFPVL